MWSNEIHGKLILAIVALSALRIAPVDAAQNEGATGSAPAVVVQNASPDTREEFVEEPIFGGRVYLQQRGLGNSQTVVFVHGIGDNGARDWDNIIPSVSKRYHTIAFDLPGFGRSDKGNEAYSPKNYAKFVNWVVMTYTKKPVILVGHSMGGAISLYYAAERPERVRRLILFNAAGVLHRAALLKFLASLPAYVESDNPVVRRSASNVSAWLARAIERGESLSRRFGGMIDEARVRQLFVDDTPMTIAGAALMDTDFSALVSKVSASTFIVWGERDRIAPLRTGQVLAEWLPRAELITLPEAAHVPMNEMPERALEIIEARLSAPDIAPRAVDRMPVIKDDAPTLRCEDGRDKSYTGAYSKIELVRCVNVELKNVTAREVVITDSTVSMLNVRIANRATAITVVASELNATNLRVDAEVALQTTNSRMDFAGAELVAARHAVVNDQASSIVCSLCKLQVGGTSRMWHDVYDLKPSTNY